jgi:metal transporter CNNM
VLQVHEEPLPTLSEDEEAVGIITMEDVIEELLQVSFCEVLIF